MMVKIWMKICGCPADDHQSNMGCLSCDLVVPNKRNALISSPVLWSTCQILALMMAEGIHVCTATSVSSTTCV